MFKRQNRLFICLWFDYKQCFFYLLFTKILLIILKTFDSLVHFFFFHWTWAGNGGERERDDDNIGTVRQLSDPFKCERGIRNFTVLISPYGKIFFLFFSFSFCFFCVCISFYTFVCLSWCSKFCQCVSRSCVLLFLLRLFHVLNQSSSLASMPLVCRCRHHRHC